MPLSITLLDFEFRYARPLPWTEAQTSVALLKESRVVSLQDVVPVSPTPTSIAIVSDWLVGLTVYLMAIDNKFCSGNELEKSTLSIAIQGA